MTHARYAMILGILSIFLGTGSVGFALSDWRLLFLGPVCGLFIGLFAHRLNSRDALEHGFPDDALAPCQSRLPLAGLLMNAQMCIFIYGMTLAFLPWLLRR